jgi:hypothetical protein
MAFGAIRSFLNRPTRIGSRLAGAAIRAHSAASAVNATSLWARRGAVMNGVARGFSNIEKTVFNKRLAAFALTGSFLIGGGVGFTREIVHNPTTNALLSDYMVTNVQDERSLPLGYTSEDYYYRPPKSDLMATGELALALFKTRHGR